MDKLEARILRIVRTMKGEVIVRDNGKTHRLLIRWPDGEESTASLFRLGVVMGQYGKVSGLYERGFCGWLEVTVTRRS